PVERRACRACAVEARYADDDDLIRGIENPSRRRLEDARSRVEADEVVVTLEQPDYPVEIRLADRLRDPRVVVGRDDLEPARRLRRVPTDVGVTFDLPGVCEQRRQVGGGLTANPVRERSGIGVAVDRDHAIASMDGERVPDEEARARLADASLTRDERDLATA